MVKESHENFSNFDLGFGLEMSKGENQNTPNSKPTNENNSAEEDGSSKKRRFAVVETAKIDLDSSTGTQNNSDEKRISLAEMSEMNLVSVSLTFI